MVKQKLFVLKLLHFILCKLGNWSGTFLGDLTNPCPKMKIGLVFPKAQEEIWVNWAWSYPG